MLLETGPEHACCLRASAAFGAASILVNFKFMELEAFDVSGAFAAVSAKAAGKGRTRLTVPRDEARRLAPGWAEQDPPDAPAEDAPAEGEPYAGDQFDDIDGRGAL